MTKTQHIIDLLLATGHSEVTDQSRTKKYRVFQPTQPVPVTRTLLLPPGDDLIFVGRSAAVRKGKNVTSSLSLDSALFTSLLELWAKKSTPEQK